MTSKNGIDYFYFNANYTNNDSKTIEANFQSDNTKPILTNPSEFDMSIVRFTCPGSLLPIFIFRPQTYYVSLSYQGVVSDHSAGEVKYINVRNGLPTTSPVYYYVNDYLQFITMINNAYIAALTSLQTNCAAMGVSLPSQLTYAPFLTLDTNNSRIRITTQNTPYLATDPYAIYPESGSTAIDVWCNLELSKFLTAFQIVVRTSYSTPSNPTDIWSNSTAYALNALVYYNGTAYKSMQNANTNHIPSSTVGVWWQPVYGSDQYQKFVIEDYYYNGINTENVLHNGWSSQTSYSIGNIVRYQQYYYISLTNANINHVPTDTLGVNWDTYYGYSEIWIEQQYVALYSWNQAKFIVFTTNSIPVAPEQLPSTNGITAEPSNFRKIISDFALSTNIGSEIRSVLTYNPTAEYRRISLISNDPLYTIDIKPYWMDADNKFYPLYINPGDQITVKILFERKV